MLYLRRILSVTLSIALLAIVAAPAGTETPDENIAVKLLLKAQLQYQSMNFASARDTLWQAYGKQSDLSEPQRKMLNDRLGEVDQAIQQSIIARAIYKVADKAMKQKNWRLARDGFSRAADCRYLPTSLRSKARRKLATAETKLASQLASAAEKSDRRIVIILADKPKDVKSAKVEETKKKSAVKPKKTVKKEPVKSRATLEKIARAEKVTEKKPAAKVTKKPVKIAKAPAKKTAKVAKVEKTEKKKPVAVKPVKKPAPIKAIKKPIKIAKVEKTEKKKPAAKAKKTEKKPAVAKPVKKPAKPAKAPARPRPVTLSKNQARNIRVDMLISQGKDALNKNQPEKAVKYFQRALKLAPDNELARRQLDYARRQTARPAEAGVLTDYIRQQRVAKQIAEHDIQEALRRSMELLVKPENKEAFDAAEQAAKVARNVLQNNKRLFTATEYRGKLAKTEDQIKWVQDKREAWNQGRLRKAIKQIEHADRDRQRELRLRRDRKIAELTRRAHQLRRERSYQQTLRVLDEIVELDPQNTWALDNIYMLKQFIVFQQQKTMVDAGNQELSKLSAAMRQTEIPWYDKLRYPKDWKELTARRERYGAGVASESEENRRIRSKLRQRVPVKLVGVNFFDAVDFLREVSGVNIFVNWGSLEVDNPDIRNKQVNVVLSDVTVEKALQVILDDAGGGILKLAYVISEGVININTQEKLNILIYPMVYDIRDLLIRVPNFIGSRVNTDAIGDTDLGVDSSSSGGSSSSSSGGGGLYDDEGDDAETGRESGSLTRDEMVQKLQSMIVQTIDRESWYPNGNASINELNGTLVITQTAENHRFVGDLVAKMREARTIQVSIEARFITVNTGYLSQIGVDLDFYFNIGSQIGGPASVDPLRNYPPSTIAPQFVGSTIDPYTGAAVPLRGASGWNQAGHNADTHFRKMSPISMSNSSMNFGSVFNQQTNVPSGIGTLISGPALSIAGTFLDDIQVDFLIQATQAHMSTRTLTAPRVTLFNGQRAFVSVSTQQAYIAGVEPIVSENSSGLRPIVNYAPTGTLLDVDATVSHDRRYVTMTLRPQIVTLNGNIREVPVESAESFIFIGLPNITLQDIQTTVSVPDGGTLLIGGQKLSGEIEREMGVPVISKLPIINRAFTNKGKLRDEQTLLILIKPTIIIQDEAELDPRLRREEPAFGPGLSRH